jgi:geranylgeranyl reductase family protein
VSEAHFTIAVVGAGPAGASAANALCLGGVHDVALIDRARFPRDKACGDGITEGAVDVLKEFDLGHLLAPHALISRVVVTAPSGAQAAMEPVAGERPLPAAYVIPRTIFDAALVSAALQRGAADFTGHRLEKADRRDDGRWSLALSGEPPERPRRQITADFLIGADGAVSRVRRALGLALNSDAHTSIAIRAYARLTAPRKPLMKIDMIDGIIWPGYAWIFDSGSQLVNVGLGTELVAYKAQQRRLPEVLASYLSKLGGGFDLDQASMHSAPLPLASRLPRLAHPAQSAALIGDAASMINPLTGEGISYGMVAGLLLGRELADAVRRGQDLGAAALRYEKDFRARFSAHFRNNVALRGILRFRPLAERMVGSYRRDAAYYRDALEFMLGCGNTVSAPRLFWRGLVPSKLKQRPSNDGETRTSAG